MRSKLTMMLLFGLGLYGVQSIATADSWSTYGQITSLQFTDDGELHLWASMTRHDPASCGGDRYAFPASDPHLKEKYASILLAYAAGIPVRMLIRSGSCTWTNPSIRFIQLGS